METILKKINKTDTCWLWTGSSERGYGRIYIGNKTYRAHRFVYELLKGKIPEGLELDHLCRQRNCVNPEHLEPVTHIENLRRSLPFRKVNAYCKRGHEMTPDNITHRNKNDNSRVCIKCKNENMKILNLKKSKLK